MDKKKIIIIAVAAVVAAALVITGIVLALKAAFSGESAGGNSSDITSSNVDSSSDDKVDSSSENSSNSTSDKDTSNSSSNKNNTSSEKAEIKVGSASGKKGKTVRVPVTIDSNPGIMAMLIDFEYDSKILAYKGYSEGNVLSDYEFSDKNGKLSFLCVESQNVTDTGDLFYIEFEIKSDSVKETPVKIKITDQSISNWDEQFILAKTKDGKVTIK